jgi:ribosomal protein S18 acetylase RimI-like enzyme
MTNLRSLQKHEHSMIGDIIGDSFSVDPINLWVFRNEQSLKYFYSLCAKKLYLQQGFGHVMQDGSGGSLWLPPKVKKHIPLYNSMDIAYRMIRHSGIGSIFRGIVFDDVLTKKHPTESHFYLYAIGARQGMQGKGIGGKIMEAGLKQVDAQNMPAYLESSKQENIGFYQRFGFEVIEKCTPTKHSPSIWLMWREKRK